MMKSGKLNVLLSSPYGVNVGGIARWTGHILNFNKKNDTNVVLTQYYPDIRGAYQDTPILTRLYIGITSYIPYLYGLRMAIKNNQYDVVHFVSSASISLIRDIISLKIARKNEVYTLVHFRFGRIPELFEARNWEQKLLDRVIRLTNKVVVIDKKSFLTLQKEGYDNVELLPNPLATRVLEVIDQYDNILKDDRKIVFAGHVIKTKGVFELIESCKTIANIKLKIIGNVTENMRKELVSLAGKGCENWMEITGELTLEDTIKEMLSAGVFVLPTYTEGFPNVILESMACGCPIVTTNVGAIPEMLDIENGNNYGICVEPKDIFNLKIGIEKMLNDREYALNCGMNAQKRVNELYSIEKVWEQLECLWSV